MGTRWRSGDATRLSCESSRVQISSEPFLSTAVKGYLISDSTRYCQIASLWAPNRQPDCILPRKSRWFQIDTWFIGGNIECQCPKLSTSPNINVQKYPYPQISMSKNIQIPKYSSPKLSMPPNVHIQQYQCSKIAKFLNINIRHLTNKWRSIGHLSLYIWE